MNLIFKNISYNYGSTPALLNINLSTKAGQILSLLGPSGCGKTTLLNLTAGILKMQSGEIRFGDQLIASVHDSPPPEVRPVGLVFQDGALFPHLTVAQNIAFGVTERLKHKALVGELLEQVGLEGYGGRYPHTLSGGQQQRVAVARALAPRPSILLMDEPFANIDIMRRKKLREQTRRLLRQRNCTAIMVTHDPEEALEISDYIAVMEAGAIIQHGTADRLYVKPSSLTAAMLTGGGTTIAIQRVGETLRSEFGDFAQADFELETIKTLPLKGHLFCRPFEMGLKTGFGENLITDVRRTGHGQLVTLKSPSGQDLTLQVDMNILLSDGQKVALVPKPKSLLVFPEK